MARNRMIKKEFWTSEQIINLPIEARLLFIGMWNQADDDGILKNSALQLKAQLFPCDQQITLDVLKDYLNYLLEQQLIVVNDTNELIRIKKWKDHQIINRPTPSKYNFIEGKPIESVNTHGAINEASLPIERNRIESKVKEKNIKVQVDFESEFELFWDVYPRKEDKKRALRAFKNLTKANRELCLEGVNIYIQSLQVRGTSDKKLIKLPTTYINGEHWNDELDTANVEDEFKYDSTGNSIIGYCSKCGISDFYKPDKVRVEDSRCCKSQIVAKKPKNGVSKPKQVVRYSSSSYSSSNKDKGTYKTLSSIIKEKHG